MSPRLSAGHRKTLACLASSFFSTAGKDARIAGRRSSDFPRLGADLHVMWMGLCRRAPAAHVCAEQRKRAGCANTGRWSAAPGPAPLEIWAAGPPPSNLAFFSVSKCHAVWSLLEDGVVTHRKQQTPTERRTRTIFIPTKQFEQSQWNHLKRYFTVSLWCLYHNTKYHYYH